LSAKLFYNISRAHKISKNEFINDISNNKFYYQQ
jgi:hypothetical protein